MKPNRHGTAPSADKPIALRFYGTDREMAAGIKSGHPGAMEALFDRYGSHVERIVNRLLGMDSEFSDVVHDIFVAAYTNIRSLKDDAAIKGWITSLAVFTVRQRIRKRARRRVHWVYDADISEAQSHSPTPSDRELLQVTYRVLDEMNADERITFSLRFIEGMEITEVASACGVSPSTVKRRQRRAEQKFLTLARKFPGLLEQIERGDRWRTQ
ncbi:MAG: sigma-70 family RNA polymerase sigma factor [Deltaproteobacteria bacterium]|nr:sigma-70 family RNA polymerase sigma factor [Deltaproteobacteria bacterium]MBN2671970.1 sigma-70 family RNA polymerase sigma factor [Deltaproteobacteria bacterium]